VLCFMVLFVPWWFGRLAKGVAATAA
jgi:hypothetical protein